MTNNHNNKTLAEHLQKELNEFTKTNRKSKKMTGKYMYDKLNPTGVLIECGFLSNYFDRTNLLNENYIKKLSAKITEALINYFYA